MAFANNNKKNARFNPNARDDRVLPGYISSRRVHKERKVVEDEIREELISTDASHVLSMEPDTRLDWFQMALMQAAGGKLKATALVDVLMNPRFATSKQLRAMVLANLHLFSPKQQKALKEVVSNPGNASDAVDGGGDQRRSRSRSRSHSRSRSRRRRRKKSNREATGRRQSASASRSRGQSARSKGSRSGSRRRGSRSKRG